MHVSLISRFWRLPLIARIPRVLALALFVAGMPLAAQTVALRASVGGRTQISPSGKLQVPLVVDMSAAGALNVASIASAVSWDPARLTFDSATAGGFGTFVPNLANAGAGAIQFSTTSATGTTATVTVANLFFTGATNGTTAITFAGPSISNDVGANLVSQLRLGNLDVCVAPTGPWGDANGDGAVNIIDAQQIARFSVGLGVANAAVLSLGGDVTNDGQINIIDAQQIARFSVSLSAAARINTLISPPPAASTMAIASVLDAAGGFVNAGVAANLAGLVVGKQAQIKATAQDAGSVDITACAALTYSSSTPGVATVSTLGLINAIAGGTTTITVSSGSASANVNLTVIPASSLVFSVQPNSAIFNNAISPSVRVTALDALGHVATGFTGAVTVAFGANPGGGTLDGTLTIAAVAGVATFSDLSVFNAATGYTLVATSPGLPPVTSAAFDITASPLMNAWTNAAGGTWNTPGNWSLGRVPNATDSIVIALPGTYTVTQNVAVSAAYVTIGASSGTITWSAQNTLAVTNAMLVATNANVVLLNGAVSGAGVVLNKGVLTAQNTTISAPLINSVTLIVHNTVNLNGTVSLPASSVLRVEGTGANAVLNISASVTNSGRIELTSTAATGATLSVTGTLTNAAGGVIAPLVGGAGTRTLPGTINNQGTLDVSGGIDLNLPAAFSNSGTVNIGTGRVLTAPANAVFTDAGGAITGPGTFAFNASTLTLSGPLSNAVTTFTFATALINGTGTFTNAAGQTLATLNTTFAGPFVNQGTFVAHNTVNLNGTVSLPASSVLRVEGTGANAVLNISASVTNSGRVELTSTAVASATLNVTGTLTNALGGVIAPLVGGGGTRTLPGTINNQGMVDVSGGIDLNLPAAFTNSGTVNIGTGRVLTVPANAVFTDAGGAITGPGTFAFNASTLTLSGPLSNAVTTFTFATALINGTGTFTNATGQTLTALNTTFAGPFVNQGTFVAHNTVTLSGAVSLPASSLLRVEGTGANAVLNISASVTNSGRIELTSTAASGAALNVTGTLTNAPGGVIVPLVGGAGSRTLPGTINNQGTLDVSGGIDLNLPAAFTNSGAVNIGTGRVLTVPANAVFTDAGGAITGPGTFAFNASTLTLSGPLSNAVTTFTFATALINGTGTFTNAAGQTLATLNTTFAGPFVNQGTFVAHNTVNLNGTVSLPASSVLRVEGTGANAVLNISASVTNSGRVELTSTAVASATLNVTGTLTNAPGGIIAPLVGGGGGRTLPGTIDNQGTLDVSNGIDLNMPATFTNSGTVNIGTGRVLTVPANAVLTNTGGAITGPGTLAFNASTLTLNGPVSNAVTTFTFATALINGTGTFTNAAGQTLATLNTTFAGPFVNQGTFVAHNTVNLNGTVSLPASSVLRVEGAGANAVLNISASVTNAGRIELTSTAASGATLNVTGTLTNALGGVIAPLVGGGGTRTLPGTINNQGTLDVSGGIDLNMPAAFTNSGTVNIGTGRVLTVPANAVFTDAGGAITGPGTFAFNASTLTLSGPLSNAVTTFTFATALINGTGTFTNATGQTLTALNTTFAGPFVNQGTFVAHNTVNLNGTVSLPASSVLRVEGTGANSVLNISASVTNSGRVELTSTAVASATLNVTGTLTNAAGGVIAPLAGGGGARSIGSNVDNQGTMDLSPSATITMAVSGNFTHSGTINSELSSVSSFDKITVSGNVTLGGTLNVALINGFTPVTTQTFSIMTWTGTRTGTTNVVLPGSPAMSAAHNANALVITAQ